jgi:hypothetical protein
MSIFPRLGRRAAAAGLLALAVAGCTPNKPAAAPAESPKPQPLSFGPGAQLMQRDAVPEQVLFTQLIAYKITVPAGTVSRSDEFWKHIDEHAVDVPTYELLYKNGVRVGMAAASEWDYLKDILEQNPAVTQPSSYAGREAKDIELELKLKVPYQDLFVYDTAGELSGRTFERCDNLMRVSFQPTPRRPGTVRLGLCPVVRSLRERIIAVGDVNVAPYQWVHPEQLFDLNLTADVPLDGFLVVAPSPEGKWPTSLGNSFLVGDGPTAQTETLLIFRPVTYRTRADVKNVAATQP